MLSFKRNHDFQVFMTPEHKQPTQQNPPNFNWPSALYNESFTLELSSNKKLPQWRWENITSPFTLPFLLPQGDYRWRLINTNNEISKWFKFEITKQTHNYLAPTAEEIFKLCQHHEQFLMYFNEDIESVRIASWDAFHKLKKTAELVNIENIAYPTHYRRGNEEGKRTAIANVRNWIDRDLISLTQLYKIWKIETYGHQAVNLLLRLSEWSPEGPASLLRPCTWGDEVGLSLARNIYLAYHWLSPLMTKSEKDFIRPMLIRIAYQMEERLEQDQFKQYPGHSHTSRLPAYLGVAALVLHKEFNQTVCERWLDYSLMIYQNVLPFYGGNDGSWAEGPFYSSSYTKWQHPFFLSIERISGFSFYNHPFYKNYHKFAMDFVATENSTHPFGDGFWCKREGKEWPGFFAQNPLRIYAERFGDQSSIDMCKKLESQINTYELHLLDIIPTIKQIEFSIRPIFKDPVKISDFKYYDFAGLGKARIDTTELYFRASKFGNSSHRHADQGNIALIDNTKNVIIPSGSYGYRFGSNHHNEWTRTTKAHNLPLIGGLGQILDDESATGRLLKQQSGEHWYLSQIDLSKSYRNVKQFIRTIVMVDNCGLLIIDNVSLNTEKSIQWRLHSELTASISNNNITLQSDNHSYTVEIMGQKNITPTIAHGYNLEKSPNDLIISDVNEDIYHLEWQLPSQHKHFIVASCTKNAISYLVKEDNNIEITINDDVIYIDTENKK
ncbi:MULTISPECIES: heparinase II/III family protein [unclassified Aliivibrio]|uniref:heparinase II/III domain-containing protein n=1 Tax=unclassified Aliivibrio TaxID=2645654 RepID=UPI00080DB532|nr:MULTISPECIES: heparinase II/III family protein [unclassified Aliivibrio]OCH17483.1 heparinase [Aliivibrio sp. 1S165]OCH23460.1 heparinase [Aliivibrio sp. 1S128]OCH34476.1 heparinase [Aliivibrio sp. 1S175]